MCSVELRLITFRLPYQKCVPMRCNNFYATVFNANPSCQLLVLTAELVAHFAKLSNSPEFHRHPVRSLPVLRAPLNYRRRAR